MDKYLTRVNLDADPAQRDAAGDPTERSLLGTKISAPVAGSARVFWTQQHGDNNVWEVVPHRRTTPA
jgi:hypothetical protein